VVDGDDLPRPVVFDDGDGFQNFLLESRRSFARVTGKEKKRKRAMVQKAVGEWVS